MKLDAFIKETLTEIITGVREAQAVAMEHGAEINPYRGSTGQVRDIEFDVEVSTAVGSEAKGAVGVFVGAVGIGVQGKDDEQRRAVGRIRFAVPTALPNQPKQK